MSTTQSAEPLSPQDAYGLIHQRVYAPVFREKLASFGIVPQDDAELAEMIEMAGSLRQAYEANRQKQAASQTSTLSKFRGFLNSELEKRGFATRPNANEDAWRKQACANAAKDAQLAHAVLSLQFAHQTNQAAA